MSRSLLACGALTASLVAVLAAGCATRAVPSPGARPVTSPSASPALSYDDLVLRTGDHVEATGRVVAVPGRPVRFCAPVPTGLPAYKPGYEPAPAYCEYGVDVRGVNLAALTRRREKDGSVEGYATLEVTYEGHGRVSVLRQAAYRDPRQPLVASDHPPCSAPRGGWPVGPADENIPLDAVEAYGHDHPGVVFAPALLRPSRTQVLVYVLTLGDPELVAAALRRHYGSRLCVVRSRYIKAEVETAAHAFESLMASGPVFAVGGGGLGPHAQPVVDVELVSVTPRIATLADRQPAGLVRLQPWLRPRRAG